MKKRYICLFLSFFFLCLIQGQAVNGAENDKGEIAEVEKLMEELKIEDIDTVISDHSNDSFSFSNYVLSVIKGDTSLSFQSMLGAVGSSIKNEFGGSGTVITRLLTIALISAIFTNFSKTFQNSHAADTGHFVTFLLMIALLAGSYITAASIAKDVINSLLEFMKVMVPVYSMSIVFSAGTGTSAVFHQVVMVLITLIDYLLLKIVLPLINMYLMAMLANYLTEEDILTKLAELISMVVGWILKTVLALVIGISTIQSLITPAVDNMKNATILKWASAIPGIGGLLSGVTETILGAGSLLKNAVGAGAVIAIFVIIAVPVVKLLVFAFLYKAGCAVMQPIADKRLISSVNSCVESTFMLLRTTCTAGILFLIVIVLAAISTTMYL